MSSSTSSPVPRDVEGEAELTNLPPHERVGKLCHFHLLRRAEELGHLLHARHLDKSRTGIDFTDDDIKEMFSALDKDFEDTVLPAIRQELGPSNLQPIKVRSARHNNKPVQTTPMGRVLDYVIQRQDEALRSKGVRGNK